MITANITCKCLNATNRYMFRKLGSQNSPVYVFIALCVDFTMNHFPSEGLTVIFLFPGNVSI